MLSAVVNTKLCIWVTLECVSVEVLGLIFDMETLGRTNISRPAAGGPWNCAWHLDMFFWSSSHWDLVLHSDIIIQSLLKFLFTMVRTFVFWKCFIFSGHKTTSVSFAVLHKGEWTLLHLSQWPCPCGERVWTGWAPEKFKLNRRQIKKKKKKNTIQRHKESVFNPGPVQTGHLFRASARLRSYHWWKNRENSHSTYTFWFSWYF